MKKEFNLKNQYIKSWNYIKQSRNFIWCIVLIFLIFTVLGFLFPTPEFIRKLIIDFLKSILEKTKGFYVQDWISFIFLNNLQSSFFGLLFGLFFGIYPILGAIANGYVLGFVGNMAVSEVGLLSLWRIFPHGIFELPAVFISLGLGMRIGIVTIQKLFQKKKIRTFQYYLLNSLRVFFYVVIPLLIIAALIEGVLISISIPGA